MFLCTIYVHSAQAQQKRVLDALTLELQMVMNDHVGAGTPACVLFKSSKWSTPEPSLQPHLHIF